MADVVVLEIRGVGGATAEEILGGRVIQTAGDQMAGFYRLDGPASSPDTEAYEWGRLTSGSRTSALWWILFPFTLINVAGWMFRPSADESGRSDESQRSLLWFSRLIVVAGGLALTAVYVLWTIALTTEMVAFGCSADPKCADRWYMAPITLFGEDNGIWLVTCGIGLAAIILLGLFLFILRTQDRLEGYETDTTRRLISAADGRRTSRLRRNTPLEDQAFWYKWAEHRRLFRWHLALTMILLGAGAGHAIERIGWQAPQGNAWWAIIAVVGVILSMVWSLTRPERFREASSLDDADANSTTTRVGWMMTHLGLALAGAIVGLLLTRWLQSGPTPQFGYLSAVRALSGILYVEAILTLVVLAVRKSREASKTSWPLALMPGLAGALAIIITGAGFAAIADLGGRFLLGADWVNERGFNIVIVDIFALSVIVAAAAAALSVWRTEKPTPDVTSDYFGDTPYADLSDRERSWVDSIAMSRVVASTPRSADQMLATVTIVMVALTFVQAIAGGFRLEAGPGGAFTAPLFGIDGLNFFHTIAATATVLYLFPGVQLIRATSKSRESRRQIGKVWDVLSFWPRRYHPLASPCYAERAVPEFRNRIRAHLRDGKRVVVSAHSQGTVIAFAALVQIASEGERVAVDLDDRLEAAPASTYKELDAMVQTSQSQRRSGSQVIEEPGVGTEPSLANVGLVTFGSPLSSLYGPFYPWHFGRVGRFQDLRNKLAPLPSGGRAWRSLWRPTDYIGQKVFIAPGGGLDPVDDAADIPVNESLQPLFAPESHSNYERERVLRETLKAFVDDLSAD